MKVKNIIKLIILFLFLMSFFYVLLYNFQIINSGRDIKTIDISEALSGDNVSTVFRKAVEQREFHFPADHGPHNEYKTEWWYFTGHLQDQGNRNYGYQLTFFRRGLRGSVERSNDSIWRSGNIYFAHFALTDVIGKKYYSYEKWGRGIKGLAGARGNPLNVWIDNWNLKHDNGEFILKASKDNNTAIELVLVPLKDIVLHGESGLSAKSSDSGNASYYYSITKLETSGIITKDNITYKVKGSSWFDHEWSTSILSLNQEGWDWFSIQLHDNSEIMLYQLRLKNGGIDPVSSGTYVSNTGKIQNLGNSDFTIEILSTWKSVNTKTEYPVKWKVDIPKLSKSFLVEPLLVNQEFSHSFTYWEGAVKVLGKDGTYGSGYVELTGY